MPEKTLWDLSLFEELEISRSCKAIRVPGGWIFINLFFDAVWIEGDPHNETRMTSVFVPYTEDL